MQKRNDDQGSKADYWASSNRENAEPSTSFDAFLKFNGGVCDGETQGGSDGAHDNSSQAQAGSGKQETQPNVNDGLTRFGEEETDRRDLFKQQDNQSKMLSATDKEGEPFEGLLKGSHHDVEANKIIKPIRILNKSKIHCESQIVKNSSESTSFNESCTTLHPVEPKLKIHERNINLEESRVCSTDVKSEEKNAAGNLAETPL